MSRRRPTKPRHVYFIEAGKGGAIKIGVAVDVAARMRDLQGANARTLSLIVSAPGDHKIETSLHRRFRCENTGGEWFKACGAVRAFALSLVEMTEDDRIAAIARETESVKPSAPDRRKIEKIKRRPWLGYTPSQLHALFHVNDGSTGVYLSTEAEELMNAYRRERYRFGLRDDGRHSPSGI